MPAPGYIVFKSATPNVTVTVLAGDGAPTVTDGYGGWDEIARPRRIGMATWNGYPALRLSIPIVFNSVGLGNPAVQPSGAAIERDIALLEGMARSPRPAKEPPAISLDCHGALIPHKDIKKWVIENIEWGDALRNSSGDRIRQDATVTLMEKIEDAAIEERSAANRAREKSGQTKKHPGRYTVKKGDTLSKIARVLLGDADRWVEIAKLNNIRDPRTLKVGRVLKLPK